MRRLRSAEAGSERGAMTPEERAARVEEIRKATPSDGCAIWQERQFLLAELDRVTAERDEYRLGAEVGNRIGTGAIRERDAALARMEMLREALTEATRHSPRGPTDVPNRGTTGFCPGHGRALERRPRRHGTYQTGTSCC